MDNELKQNVRKSDSFNSDVLKDIEGISFRFLITSVNYLNLIFIVVSLIYIFFLVIYFFMFIIT